MPLGAELMNLFQAEPQSKINPYMNFALHVQYLLFYNREGE